MSYIFDKAIKDVLTDLNEKWEVPYTAKAREVTIVEKLRRQIAMVIMEIAEK